MSTPVRNLLGSSSSTYLLQHAANPVHWQPWSEDAWELARTNNKLVCVSIGYASCHWCHVMEHESFENAEVAALMNEHFVCIKVDREERPDVDHVYMDAVTMMTGHGGWPLNCFCLPDGRPVYGGTYFPRDRWMQVLRALADVYASDPTRVETSAAEAMSILQQRSQPHAGTASEPRSTDLLPALSTWMRTFDTVYGGEQRAPKFPMPSSIAFLMRCSEAFASAASIDAGMLSAHVRRTLTTMALGGIYDHLNGAFARYSTDVRWKVPHFEKMLYDNSQLIALYADAFRWCADNHYKEVAEQTIHFVENTLAAEHGLFAAAMDADSEGKEGAYFVWSAEQIATALGADADVFTQVYNIRSEEIFEHDWYVLHRSRTDAEAAADLGMSVEQLRTVLQRCHGVLRGIQAGRVPPQRDENVVVSWNALMVSAYVRAFRAFGNPDYLQKAMSLFHALMQHGSSHISSQDHQTELRLNHICSRTTVVPGFLEDYACMLQAAADLYEATSDEQVLSIARSFIAAIEREFASENSALRVFTPKSASQLVINTVEVYDNVIPSSNSVLATALYKIGILSDTEELVDQSLRMLRAVVENTCKYPSSFAHWGSLLLDATTNSLHVKVSGAGADTVAEQLYHEYLPNVFVQRIPEAAVGANHADALSIIICDRHACMAPVHSVEAALELLRSHSKQ
jgi:uncharacterized protein YyaL (SSP411 family)